MGEAAALVASLQVLLSLTLCSRGVSVVVVSLVRGRYPIAEELSAQAIEAD